ncbi:hypothetical protein RJT34_20394 [Clitoria ternatea]|uniref:Uncharacterized protein n=1 Tax=Clitoria ternatea TaxID=43366 RepID=A0AAN9P4V7_CLITE
MVPHDGVVFGPSDTSIVQRGKTTQQSSQSEVTQMGEATSKAKAMVLLLFVTQACGAPYRCDTGHGYRDHLFKTWCLPHMHHKLLLPHTLIRQIHHITIFSLLFPA